MLDRHLHPRIKPLLHQCVRVLDKPGITPDGLTLVGFAIGVLALPFLALGWYPAALVAIVLNRLLDGLDGALARRRGLTDAGGFLDIALDFLFYALVPFGFALAAPAENALAAAWLLFAFIGTGSSFLAFAALAAEHRRVLGNHPGATELSAGMSADLEAAVRHGSTCVRVGTALMGQRPLTSP